MIIEFSKHLHCFYINHNISSCPTLESCLFAALRLNKNASIDKYKYFGYGIGFHRHGFFSHPSGGTCKSLTISEYI